MEIYDMCETRSSKLTNENQLTCFIQTVTRGHYHESSPHMFVGRLLDQVGSVKMGTFSGEEAAVFLSHVHISRGLELHWKWRISKRRLNNYQKGIFQIIGVLSPKLKMSFQRGNQTSLRHGGEEINKSKRENWFCQLENHSLHVGKILYFLRSGKGKKEKKET